MVRSRISWAPAATSSPVTVSTRTPTTGTNRTAMPVTSATVIPCGAQANPACRAFQPRSTCM